MSRDARLAQIASTGAVFASSCASGEAERQDVWSLPNA